MADAFLDYESPQGKPWEQVLLQMADKLPEALLARALAEEGLLLMDQITWEVYIYEHNQEAFRKPDQSSALTAIAGAVQGQRVFLKQTVEQMNSLIQLTMDVPNKLSGIVDSLKNALDSKVE